MPAEPCSITSEDFAPLRTAKIHVAFRQEPLEAMQAMQDIMCHLVLFECNECRIRFPAFHPDFTPEFDLQCTKQCRNAVASWEGDPPSAACAKRAPVCRGVCKACADELEKDENHELLKGVVRFGAANSQDPLAGFPATDRVVLLDMELQDLFRQATVLEAMLVSLNHMQVCVCTFSSRTDSRTGLSRFRKNIIAFPQHVSDLQQHMSFVQSVRVNDIVNVALTDDDTRLQKARVVRVRPQDFLVEIAGCSEKIAVSPSQVRSRLHLPWRPRELEHALIVLRRRSNTKAEFVEDLRVRRPFVVALLRALSKRDTWRPNRGVEPMHMYYTEFDWLPDDEIEELFPENDVPATLISREIGTEEEPTSLTCAVFQDWLREGQSDCETAQAMLRFWNWGQRRASDHDTEADFFDQLFAEYVEKLPAEARRLAEESAPELPVSHVAALIHIAGYPPFDTTGLTEEVIRNQLCEDILSEVAKVQAYMAAWKGSTLVAEPDRKGVAEEIEEVCANAVRPWPVIEKTPVAMNEEGRFVKAFPLEFPMGVGDLKQPQVRGDFTAAEWAQHKFRYWDGRFVNSGRGHRVAWAIFNSVLLDRTRQSAHAYHTATDSHVLTKRDLRKLVTSRDDLVREMAAQGAEIPTSPMFWKRTTRHLEWCVRFMSWFVPWVRRDDGARYGDDEQSVVAAFDAAASRASSSAGPPARPSTFQNELPTDVHEAPCDAGGEDDEDGEGERYVSEPPAAGEVDASEPESVPCIPAETVWAAVPTGAGRKDDYGLGRIPAFWFTLNCPYNYLHELHRFHADDGSLTGCGF